MSLKNKKVLLTYGPTWTAIDRVRVISNISSGEMGRELLKHLKRKGARITALQGPIVNPSNVRAQHTITYSYFNELKELLKEQLKKKYDVIIHAAAVCDYRVKNPLKAKMSSGTTERHLTLIPTEKLIRLFKILSPRSFLVGFKLEIPQNVNDLKRKTAELFSDAHCDLVLANSAGTKYTAYILNNDLAILAQASSRADIARRLVNLLDKKL